MEHTEYIELVIRPARAKAYEKAIQALAGYKFLMLSLIHI